MSHIIGRPNDDLLDIMLGPSADPEQAFIGGSRQGPEEGHRSEDRAMGDEPHRPGGVGRGHLGLRDRRRPTS